MKCAIEIHLLCCNDQLSLFITCGEQTALLIIFVYWSLLNYVLYVPHALKITCLSTVLTVLKKLKKKKKKLTK